MDSEKWPNTGRGAKGVRGGRGRVKRGRGRGRDHRTSLEDLQRQLSASSLNAADVSDDRIEPCKVYVGNLRPRVMENDIREAFSHYVEVVNVIIIKDKFTRRSRGFGFVTVRTSEDRDKLLQLKHNHQFIQGQAVVIKPAWKRVLMPGDPNYVRMPLSDRDFDLSSPNPDVPSIHMLVDDVLFKILDYLCIKQLVGCERVCRRWQSLVHEMFMKMLKLELSPGVLGLHGPLTRPIISKLLVLSGPTLRELKVQSVDYATRHSILRAIGQVCPQLECLDVTQSRGINLESINELASNCKKLKTFIAEKCPSFIDKVMRCLCTSYPNLERLNVASCPIDGKCFSILPTNLKELNISLCDKVTEASLLQIAERCPNLESLNLENVFFVTPKVIENIGKNCPNLQKLVITYINAHDVLHHMKKLQSLKMSAETVDLSKLIEDLPHLQKLDIVSDMAEDSNPDFSRLKNLKSVSINIRSNVSLSSLAKCSQLEDVIIRNCGNVTINTVSDILRGCLNLKSIRCPNVEMTMAFISSVNKIVERRTNKVTIAVRANNLSPKELLEAKFDDSKVEFDLISGFPFLDDFEDDYSLYSDDSMDNDFWPYDYDSDHSLPDALFYGDDLDFLDPAFHLYGVMAYDIDGDSDLD